MDGEARQLYENGRPSMIGNNRRGQRDGVWTWYDEDGKLTAKKHFKDGLLQSDEKDLDSYLEKFEYYLLHRDHLNSVKQVELALGTMSEKNESNRPYMNLKLFHAKSYYLFSHFRQGERVLLETIGLTPAQCEMIQDAYLVDDTAKLTAVINDIKKNNAETAGKHVALGLCYNLVHDSVLLKQEQQLSWEKGNDEDWPISIAMELYRLATARYSSLRELNDVNEEIARNGATEKLLKDKALLLLRTERFAEAEQVLDDLLKDNGQDVDALLLKSDVAMAQGDMKKMELCEERAKAIDPKAIDDVRKRLEN